MTGYEIYDEGYEAGYESAMQNFVNAMEMTDEHYEQFKKSLSGKTDYELGRITRNYAEKKNNKYLYGKKAFLQRNTR